jgi:hypothetical protein
VPRTHGKDHYSARTARTLDVGTTAESGEGKIIAVSAIGAVVGRARAATLATATRSSRPDVEHDHARATVEDLREVGRVRADSRSHASGQEEFDEKLHE